MVTIRPALPSDIEAIAAIHTYYVLHTVNSFTAERRPLDQYRSTYTSIVAGGLPYLVAVDDGPSGGTVLGYANAHDFRGGVGSAYRHTVEISLFCHPDRRGQGVGSLLLGRLVAALRDPAGCQELYLPDAPGKKREVREVISVMAVDEMAEDKGQGLKRFYEKFGFVLKGHFPRVGYKFGRWVDTMYLQMSLGQPGSSSRLQCMRQPAGQHAVAATGPKNLETHELQM